MSLASDIGRLEVLQATQLLDSEPEPAFDRLTRLAASLLGAPTALVSLVDAHRQFFKSGFGLSGDLARDRETPLSHSFCKYVALADSVVSEIRLRMALQSARDAQALTTAIVESMGDACIAIDPAKKFVLVNPAASRLLAGAEVGKPVPDGWSTMHHSKRLDGTPMKSEDGALGRGLRGLDTNGLTFTVQRPGTTEPVWVEVSGRPMRDRRQQVVGSVAVYRDITAVVHERQLEVQLRRSEQIHRAIVQHLPNGAIFVVDRDLRYVSAEGPLIADMLRRTDLDGLVGRYAADVVSPANRDAILAQYRRALAGERSSSEIERDGRFFEVSVVPIADGKEISHALITSYDVTDRRREAIELREARDSIAREQALLDTALENIEDGVALIDSDSRILVANRAFAAMLAMPVEQVVGLTRKDFVAHVGPMLAEPDGFAEALDAQPPNVRQEFVFARPRRRILTRTWTRVPAAGETGSW